MDLTKEHFDKALGGIRGDVVAIKTGMINLATQDSVDELGKTVAKIETSVNGHTTALANLLATKKIKDDEKTVSADRFERLELWAQKVGEKIGLKLEL